MQSSTIIFLLGVVTLSSAASLSDQDGAWEFFKATHEKAYSSKIEEQFRKSLFEKSVEKVRQHNLKYLSGLESYSMIVNQFADMMLNEVIGGGLLTPENTNQENLYVPSEYFADPDSKDWRNTPGVVTPVKDQGDCGSCWAFSTTGGLEGQMMLKKNKSVSLSEQQLVDCGSYFGGFGCEGGVMTWAYNYIARHGIESESDYPYTGEDMPLCKYDSSKVIAKNTGYKGIPKGDESALKSAIANVGPIVIAINANENFFKYHEGVFEDKDCNYKTNHGVLAVGYGSDDASGKDFYIVKNSWGSKWGENGYIRIVRNKNICRIASQAGFPTM